MGANIRLRTLSDLIAHGFNLRITCLNPDCGRSGVYLTSEVQAYFQSRGRRRSKNEHLEVAGGYFRCDVCKAKGAALEPVAPHRTPDLPPLLPSKYELVREHRRRRG